MKLRYSLGYKELTGINLLSDPSFLTACGAGNWDTALYHFSPAFGGSVITNEATTGHALGSGLRYICNFAAPDPYGNYPDDPYNIHHGVIGYVKNNPMVYGHRYRFKVNFSATLDSSVVLFIWIGKYQTPGHVITCNQTSFEFDFIYLGGSYNLIKDNETPDVYPQKQAYIALEFRQDEFNYVNGKSVYVSDVSLKELTWNNPLTDQPSGSTKTGFKKSDLFDSLYLDYLENITFTGDGFDYLDTNAKLNNMGIIPCKVEAQYDVMNDLWEDFHIGSIVLNESDWYRNQVICSIENSVTNRALKQNSEVKYSTRYHKWYVHLLTYCHNSHSATNNDYKWCPSFYEHLKFLFAMATDMNGYFESNVLGVGGTWEYLRETTNVDFGFSFVKFPEDALGMDLSIRQVLTGLNSLFKIGLVTDTILNVPVIRLEPYVDLLNSASVFNIYNAPNEPYKYSQGNNYKGIKFGCIREGVYLASPENKKISEYNTPAPSANGYADFTTEYIQKLADIDPASMTKVSDYYFLECFFNAISGNVETWDDPDPDTIHHWFNPNLKEESCFIRWMDVLTNHYWKLDKNIEYLPSGSNKLLIKKLSFEYPLKYSEIKALKSNPLQKLVITGQIPSSEAYIEELEWDNETEQAKFKVIST